MPLTIPEGPPVVVVRERMWIPRVLVDNEDRLRRELTLKNQAAGAARAQGRKYEGPDEYVMYEETPGHFIVPRAYRPHLRASHRVVNLVMPGVPRRHCFDGDTCVACGLDAADAMMMSELPECGEWRSATLIDHVKLGPHADQPFDQGPAFHALGSEPGDPFGRILVLRCGGGKTAIALKAAALRGGKVLWVTTTEMLLDQAKDDVERFLAVPRERIGHVQAAKMKWDGYDIAVATLQTVALSKKLDPRFWFYWDLVIFDEGDKLAAPQFSVVGGRFRGERWLLTATPKRADGMHEMYELHVGPVCYQHTQYDLEPDCWFIETGASDKHVKRAGWNPIKRERPINYPMTARSLLGDYDRNTFIVEEVRKARAKDRTVLVTGDSVEGLAELHQRLHEEGIDAALVVGQVKRDERMQLVHSSPVVVGTTQLFERGISRRGFDTLIVATMTRSWEGAWEQVAGRILRFDPQKPDKRPVIVVLVDERIDMLRNMAGKLAKTFNKFGWPMHGVGRALLEERKVRRAMAQHRGMQ